LQQVADCLLLFDLISGEPIAQLVRLPRRVADMAKKPAQPGGEILQLRLDTLRLPQCLASAAPRPTMTPRLAHGLLLFESGFT
jgi:hypothetical protein